ncbi:MAG: excalibur calcium-binding domain-containing protein [Bacteroidetes bacterium]|nr:excalibur calcium-binding domain-containing protein [Bacteroidota bacterium]
MMWLTTCDLGYPDWYVCLSKRFRTSCDAIPYRRFTATSDDPLHLDGDGDGIACEG